MFYVTSYIWITADACAVLLQVVSGSTAGVVAFKTHAHANAHVRLMLYISGILYAVAGKAVLKGILQTISMYEL